jgi:3-oxoadipate enol-lactonase
MTTLHYLDTNPAGSPAVLFLHGLGADGSSWMLQFPELTGAGFRPIAPDAAGFGGSAYDNRGWSFQRLAAQLAELVEGLRCGPVHIVGLSMGGVLAQQFALDFPQLTRKLVLVSTFSVLRPDTLSGWLYFLQRFAVVNTLGLPAQAKIVAQRVFPEPRHAPLREILVKTITQADVRAYRRAMFALGTFDSRRRLGEIQKSTLVITGENDTTVRPARQKILADGITGARQITIANAGHAIPVDQADEFNRTLLDFLKE